MDLSLSRTRRHYIERVMERGSRREREREREKPKEKCALGKKRPHSAKKIILPWDDTFSSLCIPVGKNVFAHILGRALR